jgi:subtilisin family serine protease
VVAVLDTGIDLSHPAFAGRLVPGYDFVDNDNDPSEVGQLRVNPTYGHGTHVAGIIALVAPEAKIMPIRILDTNGESDLWKLKDALIWASDPAHNADIINMSFGYPPDLTPTSNTFIQDLTSACDGVNVPGEQQFPSLSDDILIFVAGAGNGGQIGNGASKVYPAAERSNSDDNILSVGASTRYDRLASFSTMANAVDPPRDRWVRNVAPGEEIISALPGGRYGAWSGTSMSAPIVSGIAALLISVRPVDAQTHPAGAVVDEMEETGYAWDCNLPSRGIYMETSRVDAFCAVTNNQACYPVERTICNE